MYINSKYLNKLGDKFLEGYFEQEVFDKSAIDFVMSLKLLTLFEFTYRRNHSLLRRTRIASFYNKKIREFIRER